MCRTRNLKFFFFGFWIKTLVAVAVKEAAGVVVDELVGNARPCARPVKAYGSLRGSNGDTCIWFCV